MSKENRFTGTSNHGDFQEALGLAIEAAVPPGTSDWLVEWRLAEMSGSKGGIAGQNSLTVTIEAGGLDRGSSQGGAGK
ncbi:MAG TPA: hypothetical protein VF625_13050 [Longimicrobium sp.]|jgi:hypothetical protein